MAEKPAIATAHKPPRANESAWAAIEAEKANPLPTPPVGWPVQWLKKGDLDTPVAARVTKIESPGRVMVELCEPGRPPQHKTGVYVINHRVHKQKNNPTTDRCGAFRYLPGMPIPKEHYQLHEEHTAQRITSLQNAELQAEQARKAAERAKEEAAGQKQLEAATA